MLLTLLGFFSVTGADTAKGVRIVEGKLCTLRGSNFYENFNRRSLKMPCSIRTCKQAQAGNTQPLDMKIFQRTSSEVAGVSDNYRKNVLTTPSCSPGSTCCQC